jgi:hypothetical protein
VGLGTALEMMGLGGVEFWILRYDSATYLNIAWLIACSCQLHHLGWQVWKTNGYKGMGVGLNQPD